MQPYSSYSKADLVTFATGRRLTVSSTSKSKSSPGPTKHDYIKALQLADKSPSFPRFLNLPSELRTAVYQELLVLQNSYTCFPQILATCNTILAYSLLQLRAALFCNNLKYIGQLLEHFQIQDWKPISTPIETRHKFTLEDAGDPFDASLY